MIRRPAGNQFWLIRQDDHARLSGYLAERLGGNGFAPPSPREEVIAAIADHDAGWPLHDDRPTLNDHGLPLHVFETPIALLAKIWSASSERARAIGPYATLLVSLHQLALSDYAARNRTKTAADLFELNKFQHKQIELQESLRKELKLHTGLPLHLGLAADGANPAEDLLTFNFRLLTLCDRLSLQLCCGTLLFPEIEGVRPKPAAPPLTLSTRWVDDATVAVAPWPFDEAEIECEIPYRSVAVRPFESESAFRAAVKAAAQSMIKLRLLPQ
jgi:hypothetical protein